MSNVASPLPLSCCARWGRTYCFCMSAHSLSHCGKNSPRLCTATALPHQHHHHPPILVAAAPAAAAAKHNIWTWQQMSLKQAHGGREETARGTLGPGRRRGGLGGKRGVFMRTLEGEHDNYLDSAGRLIYGEVPL